MNEKQSNILDVNSELVCPWCGFNNFRVYYNENDMLYKCQTCETDILTKEHLVQYRAFEEFTRKWYISSPDILVKIWKEIFNLKILEKFKDKFDRYEAQRVANYLLGIPRDRWDSGSNINRYAEWLNNPRIALDYRDINKLYNNCIKYDNMELEMYFVDLIIPNNKRLFKPSKFYKYNKHINNYKSYSSSSGNNCGGGNIGLAIDDFDSHVW